MLDDLPVAQCEKNLLGSAPARCTGLVLAPPPASLHYYPASCNSCPEPHTSRISQYSHSPYTSPAIPQSQDHQVFVRHSSFGTLLVPKKFMNYTAKSTADAAAVATKQAAKIKVKKAAKQSAAEQAEATQKPKKKEKTEKTEKKEKKEKKAKKAATGDKAAAAEQAMSGPNAAQATKATKERRLCKSDPTSVLASASSYGGSLPGRLTPHRAPYCAGMEDSPVALWSRWPLGTCGSWLYHTNTVVASGPCPATCPLKCVSRVSTYRRQRSKARAFARSSSSASPLLSAPPSSRTSRSPAWRVG